MVHNRETGHVVWVEPRLLAHVGAHDGDLVLVTCTKTDGTHESGAPFVACASPISYRQAKGP